MSLGDLPVCTSWFGITNSLPLKDQTEASCFGGQAIYPLCLLSKPYGLLITLGLTLFTGIPLIFQCKGNLGLLFLAFLSKLLSKCF